MVNMRKIEQMLTTAIFEVFEKMFYLSTEPLRKESECMVCHMKATIRFNGPVDGMMEVYLSRGVAEAMVGNMLNIEEEEIPHLITEDCIKESLNMICGNFVRRLDADKVFQLSIPTCAMISENPIIFGQTSDHEVGVIFAAEAGHVGVSLTITEGHERFAFDG